MLAPLAANHARPHHTIYIRASYTAGAHGATTHTHTHLQRKYIVYNALYTPPEVRIARCMRDREDI